MQQKLNDADEALLFSYFLGIELNSVTIRGPV